MGLLDNITNFFKNEEEIKKEKLLKLGWNEEILKMLLKNVKEINKEIDYIMQKNYSPLFYAIINNDVKGFNFTLEEWQNIPSNIKNEIFNRENLLLHLIFILENNDKEHKQIRENQIKMIKLLIKNNKNVIKEQDVEGKNALHRATAIKGDLEITKFLIEEVKMDILQTDNYGNSLLHSIALSDNEKLKEEYEKIIEYLLKNKKIDINIKDNDGNTPLLKSLEEWHFGIATILVKKGADLNLRNNFGKGYVDIIKDYQWKMLNSHEYDYSEEKEMILNAFLNSIKNKKMNDFFIFYNKIIQESYITLLNGKDFNTSPIKTAVLNKNYKAVETLINNPFVILNDIDENNENTLLHDAIEVADYEIFQLLLKKNKTTPYEHQEINIDKKNKDSLSPLLLATKKGHLNFVEELLKENIELYITDKDDKDILSYLEELDDKNILKKKIKEEILSKMNIKN